MKKLHLISAMYVTKGHGYEYVRNFCSNLQDKYDIVLHVASKTEVNIPKDIEAHYTDINYINTSAENYLKYSFAAPYIRAIVKQYISYRYYKQILSSQHIQQGELVYIMDYDVFPLTSLIRGLKRKKISNIFLWIHSAKFQSKDLLYTLYKSLFKFIFNRIIFTSIKGIVVNGNYIKEQITKNLEIEPEKIHVIQYPSEIPFKMLDKYKARTRLGLDINANIILFFGMLRKDKNIEFTIRSVSKVNSKPKLIIAGSEASVTKLDIEYWIDKHRLANYILDIDYISEEKMALYYSCSDLLMLTYELESGSQSGPLSLAREFELPALVTNTGEIGKYVVENNVGFAADLNKEGDFTNKMNIFFDKKFNQNESLEESLKYAKNKYSWKSAKKKYLNMFND